MRQRSLVITTKETRYIKTVLPRENRIRSTRSLGDTVLLGRLHDEPDRLVVRDGDVLRAVLVPSRERSTRERGFPGVSDIDGPDRVACWGNGGGDVLVVAADLLFLHATAVGAELRGHGIFTTDNVVVKGTSTLGAANGEIGHTPDDVVGDCVGLEGGGDGSA